MVWTNQGLERDMSYEKTQDVKLLLIFFLVTWGISQEKIIFLQNTFYTNLGPKNPLDIHSKFQNLVSLFIRMT